METQYIDGMEIEEQPELGTPDRAALCFHFVDNPHDFVASIKAGHRVPLGSADDFRYCSVVCSMELDLIAYKFQDEDLMKTNLIYDIVNLEGQSEYHFYCTVEVLFPAVITYTSEGRTQRLIRRQTESVPGRNGEDPVTDRLRCRGRLARTYFKKSGMVVWNLILEAEEGTFNEYDLIKLMHLYEGRSEDAELYEAVRFDVTSLADGKSRTKVPADELLPSVWDCLAGDRFKNEYAFAEPFLSQPVGARADHRKPKGATIQLAMGEEIGIDGNKVSLERALKIVYAARREHELATRGISRGRLVHSSSKELESWLNEESGGVGGVLKAFAGITNGIFDFKEIGDEELIDTLDPTFSSGDHFIKVHRRTLVNINDTDRVLDGVSDTLGFSPYVMLPHAVVIHNEELIDRVDDCLNVFANTEKIQQLEDLKDVCLKAMRSMYVPNLFNYATEKTIYDRAFEIRGSKEKRQINLDRMGELERRIEQAYEKRRSRHDVVVQGLLFFLAAAQVMTIFMPQDQIPRISPLVVVLMGVLLVVVGMLFIMLSRR